MIDRRFVTFYQWVVDISERRPAWWIEQTACAYVAADIIAAVLTKTDASEMISIALTLFVGAVMIMASRIPPLLAVFATIGVPFRLFFLATTAFNTVILCLRPSAGNAADMLGSAMLMSYYYFAACRPPRPRKRRQLVAQGGIA